jgi:hypothetical protein
MLSERGRRMSRERLGGRRGRAHLVAAAAIGLSAGCAGDIVFEEVPPTPDAAVTITDPDDCHEWLDAHGVDFSPASESPGVEDPVTVYPPIAGIDYRVSWQQERRESMFMDCELARSLVLAAEYLRDRDIVEVADMGVYNYRCIGGGNPDDGCTPSQHAFARAIDIAGFTTADETYLSVNDDWIIDSDDIPTCEASPGGDKNRLLHELICELKADGVWNIVLTPNYNAAHRDHFHVDLSEDSDFIRARDDGVDVGQAAH